MCGICGATGHVDSAALRAMTDSLSHRGPDDAGSFEAPGIAFGVRRLGAAGRARVLERFTWEKMATEARRIFAEAVEDR